ncbi:MAG: Hpt domain-containing protein [Kiritimatiellae bacterium]|nr:Hpt domain-containing protein [Kiritimatiellia bacterium]
MKACCESYLKEQFSADTEQMDEIYTLYVESISEKLFEADKAVAEQDWTALDHVAHTIKGNALATGDTDMVNTAIQLRSSAQLHEREQSEELIVQLKELAKAL